MIHEGKITISAAANRLIIDTIVFGVTEYESEVEIWAFEIARG